MNKWTPGPWSVGYDGPSLPIIDAGIVSVAYCNYANGNSEANAHLIAAAPELYTALDNALDFIAAYINGEETGSAELVFDQVAAALVKARGEE